MIKLGLSIHEEDGAADDDLPPLDDAPAEDNTNAKMEEIDWVLPHWKSNKPVSKWHFWSNTPLTFPFIIV